MKEIVVGILIGSTISLIVTHPSHADSKFSQFKSGFNMDYEIDLKQDGYVIMTETGDQHRVELGDLENFFMRDNL